MTVTDGEEAYPSLVSEIELSGVRLRNRIAHTATVTNLGRENHVTDALLSYMERRARGGAGMVITEGLSVHPSSIPNSHIVGLFDERNDEPLANLAEKIARYDCALIGQLWHVGRQQLWSRTVLPLGVSGRHDPYSWTVPHVMDSDDINEVVEAFVAGASKLKDAGFAGVELHGAHGYLITQFLSPWSNDRTDEFGGSRANRLRFLRMIVKGIREVCGKNFIVGVKLPSDEGVEGGIDTNEAMSIAESIAGWNAISYMAFSPGNFSLSLERHLPNMSFSEEPFRYSFARLKRACRDVPMMALGRIASVGSAEDILESGEADLVGFSRAFVSDPDFGLKVENGRVSDIRPCIYCNTCWGEIHAGRPVSCIHNVVDDKRDIGGHKPSVRGTSQRARRVLVVGSGVAALEVAGLLGSAGQDVVLKASGRELGGWLWTESQLPGRADIAKELRYMVARLERHRVRIERVAPAGVVVDTESAAYEHVVIATGATNQEFALEGVGIPSSPFKAFIRRLLTNPQRANGTLVVLDEDHSASVYAGVEFAAQYYDRVVLMTPKTTFASGVPYVDTIGVYRRLFKLGIEMHIAAIPKRADGQRLVYQNPYSGDERAILEVSTFVYATPRAANDQLGRELKARGESVFMIGDCLAPRGVMAAMEDSKQVYHAIMEKQ